MLRVNVAEGDGVWLDLTPRKLMLKRILSSQLRINMVYMVSGSMTTAINAAVMVVAYPVYLHFLGYEKYGVNKNV